MYHHQVEAIGPRKLMATRCAQAIAEALGGSSDYALPATGCR